MFAMWLTNVFSARENTFLVRMQNFFASHTKQNQAALTTIVLRTHGKPSSLKSFSYLTDYILPLLILCHAKLCVLYVLCVEITSSSRNKYDIKRRTSTHADALHNLKSYVMNLNYRINYGIIVIFVTVIDLAKILIPF